MYHPNQQLAYTAIIEAGRHDPDVTGARDIT